MSNYLLRAVSTTIHSLSLRNRLLIILSIIVVLFCGYYGRPGYPFCGDPIAYYSAQKLFFNGDNPYDINLIHHTQQALGCDISRFIWNPPSLFIWLAPFLSFSIPNSLMILSISQILASLFLAWCGWLFSKSSKANLPVCLSVPIIASISWWIERDTGQISTILTAVFALGLLLFVRSPSLFSGILLSISVIKPHLFFLPLAAIIFYSLFNKYYRVLVGFALGILLSSGVAELWNPGITVAWLGREAWPTKAMGSSFPALLYNQLICLFSYDNQSLLLAIPVAAIFWLFVIIWFRPFVDVRILFSLIALTPFVAPYGFIFDNTASIMLVSYMLGVVWNAPGMQRTSILVLAGIGITLLLTAVSTTSPNIFTIWTCMPSNCWWYLPSCGLLLVWMLFCKASLPPK